MVHFQLIGSHEPVLIVESDGVDAKEVEERNAEYPAVFEEETNWNHAERHINICQKVNPDDTAAVIGCIKYCWSRDSAHSPILHTSDPTSVV